MMPKRRRLERYFRILQTLLRHLRQEKRHKYNRVLPAGDYVFDRWEKAEYLGFGKGTSVYDSCLVLGDVRVGPDTWIGPFTILDGSGGGLTIGSHCAISAGVHIYTHDTVAAIVANGDIARAPVVIGDNCYIGPNAVISMGVCIGSGAVVGANSFVKQDVPAGARAFGNPAHIHSDNPSI